jgi:predicted Zn finger-like uncharacterized protein
VNNTDVNITRCPQCATAFRVTQDVLQVANGAVRCGSCLRVFNAQAHLLSNKGDKKDTAKPQTTPEHSSESPQKDKQPTIEPENTSDTATQPDSTTLKHAIESIAYNTLSISSFDLPSDDTADKRYESVSIEFANNNSANDGEDESWALELLREAEAAEALLANSPSEDDPSLISATDDFVDNDLSISTNALENTRNKAEDLFIDIINNDLQSASEDKPTNNHADKNDGDMDDVNWAEDLLVDEHTDPSATFTPSDSSSAHHNRSSSTNHSTPSAGRTTEKDTTTNQFFSQEEPPLNLQFARDDIHFTEEKTTIKRWPWLIGSLLLLMGVMTQIAWIQFDKWSAQPSYRSYYAIACKILPCRLTEIADINQIRSTHLVVRSHPDEKNALIVDTIIANNADFRQFFPGIKLIFLDIQGESIASRVFQPKEYVKGELFGQTMMPARQSIQLSLSIVDPGDKAVNYRLEMVTPTPTATPKN